MKKLRVSYPTVSRAVNPAEKGGVKISAATRSVTR